MLEDVKRPAEAGSPYGPFSLAIDPARQHRELIRARRARALILGRALRWPAEAVVHRVRLAGLAAGRFVFDHGGVRSIHH